MTAGAVSAPLIIPMIHLQTHRAKNHIDTNTPVSIQSDTPDVLIFYTLDGSKPSFGPRESKGSRRYGGPILLPAGRVAVRAVALDPPNLPSQRRADSRLTSCGTDTLPQDSSDVSSSPSENQTSKWTCLYLCVQVCSVSTPPC
uniref:Uncharacterized protein n=1 Tax=Gasterosteus aculeatus aculeatus TaxID=481459 RepID=A0AAQ4QIT0_GASAC